MSARSQDMREDPIESGSRLETLGKVTEGVLHDFNNILAAIAGFAELIIHADAEGQNGGNRKEAKKFANYILDAADMGRTTLNSLRALVRDGKREMEPLDLHEVMESSLAMARGVLGGRVSVHMDFQLGVFQISGCRAWLQNAFINLLINAHDAMQGSGHLEIFSERGRRHAGPLASNTGWATLSIRDSGIGMTPEVRERVFDRYFTTKGAGGNGLGLANVRATILAHGGRITVDSEPGQGAEFRMEFPLLP